MPQPNKPFKERKDEYDRRVANSTDPGSLAKEMGDLGRIVEHFQTGDFQLILDRLELEGDFKLVVYNYTAEAAATGVGATSAAWSCSEGCDELRLGNKVCDVALQVRTATGNRLIGLDALSNVAQHRHHPPRAAGTASSSTTRRRRDA